MSSCSRIQPLDLLILADEHLAALVAAFLHARLLILDVIPRHTHFDKPPDEIPDVSVAAVPRVGVGDDEGPEVDLGNVARLSGAIRAWRTAGSCPRSAAHGRSMRLRLAPD